MQAIATGIRGSCLLFYWEKWAGVFKGQHIFYYDGIRTEVCLEWKDCFIGFSGKRELKRKDVGNVVLLASIIFVVKMNECE